MTTSKPALPLLALLGAFVASAVAFSVLDLVWLGVVARGFYDSHMGPLKADPINAPAAALFYGMYLSLVLVYGIHRASSVRDALRRGAELGFATYATYELTNWAVIQDWPGILVLPDLIWGVVLTGATAAAGRWVYERLRPVPAEPT